MENQYDIQLPEYTPQYVNTILSERIDWGLRKNNIPNTWHITKGKGMKALVIDTGWPNHNDIGTNAIKGKNFIPDESIEDLNGHQTHVTGIICAQNNNIGMVGVAPEATCITAKVLNRDGGGPLDALVQALEYAILTKPDVVSMSLGAPQSTAYMHALIKKLYEMNIPVVCAAGNSGTRGVDFPAAFPETIAVAAYDKNGKIANFSGVGPQVDWAAPGVDIYSTYLNNSYAVLNGTSMACPYITGVILLLIAKHRIQKKKTGQCDCNTVEDIRRHLLKYTIDDAYIGKDEHFGYGMIDVENLLLEGIAKVTVKSEKRSWWKKFLAKIKS